MITDLVNAYIGDSSVSRLYEGDNLVWDASRPDILLSYLQAGETPSSGVSRAAVYFNTGYYPDSSTDIEISYQNTIYGSLGPGYSYMLIGCSHTTGGGYSFSGDHYIASPGAGKTWRYRNNSNVLAPDSSADLNKHVIRTVNNGTSQTIYYDGVATTGSSSAMKTFELPLYLFCFNTNGNPDSCALKGTRIYYVKIWQSNNLIRFYIPVLHYTNGQYTPCFYDKVNDTYIYNLGTDTPTYKIQGDYLLDWLGSEPETSIPDSSAFYLRYDTGVVASNQLQVDTKSRVVYGRDQYIFGSGTSAQTTPTWQPYGYGTPGGTGESTLLRLRVGFGATSTTNYTTYLAAGDSSTVNAVNTLSMWCNSERGLMCLNGTMYNTQSPVPDTFPSPTIHLLARHGSSTVTQISRGARIYYINFTTANIPTRTIIPVLHNSKPEFLDLQAGTYLPIYGNTSPYGVLKN